VSLPCAPDQRGGRRAQCMKNPVPIGVGYLAQYIVKPLLGFCIAKVPLPARAPSPRWPPSAAGRRVAEPVSTRGPPAGDCALLAGTA